MVLRPRPANHPASVWALRPQGRTNTQVEAQGFAVFPPSMDFRDQNRLILIPVGDILWEALHLKWKRPADVVVDIENIVARNHRSQSYDFFHTGQTPSTLSQMSHARDETGHE